MIGVGPKLLVQGLRIAHVSTALAQALLDGLVHVWCQVIQSSTNAILVCVPSVR